MSESHLRRILHRKLLEHSSRWTRAEDNHIVHWPTLTQDEPPPPLLIGSSSQPEASARMSLTRTSRSVAFASGLVRSSGRVAARSWTRSAKEHKSAHLLRPVSGGRVASRWPKSNVCDARSVPAREIERLDSLRDGPSDRATTRSDILNTIGRRRRRKSSAIAIGKTNS